jgi:hypothetical protein
VGGILGTEALRQAEAQRVVDYLQGATGRKIWASALGTNSAVYYPEEPAAVAAMLGDVVTRIHALDPTIQCVLFGLLPRSGENNVNSLGYVPTQYTNAILAKASTLDNTYGIDCSGVWNADTDTNDGLHGNISGQQLKAAFYAETFHNLPEATEAIVAPAQVEDTDARVTKGGSWGTENYPGASNGTFSYSSTPAGSADLTGSFTGTQLHWAYLVNMSYTSQVEVYIDGNLQGTASQYGENGLEIGEFYHSPVQAQGLHTFLIKKIDFGIMTHDYLRFS